MFVLVRLNKLKDKYYETLNNFGNLYKILKP